MTSEPVTPEPDEKDWTWVLDRPCPDCGFSPQLDPSQYGEIIRGSVRDWLPVFDRADVAVRPAPAVWSDLEYGAHVRDVYDMFAGRLALMLAQENPTFPNWDQDETALAKRYWEEQPAVVQAELADAGERFAQALDQVEPADLGRLGTRSNGSEFTVATLGIYALHDILHHLHDVGAR